MLLIDNYQDIVTLIPTNAYIFSIVIRQVIQYSKLVCQNIFMDFVSVILGIKRKSLIQTIALHVAILL